MSKISVFKSLKMSKSEKFQKNVHERGVALVDILSKRNSRNLLEPLWLA